MSRRRIVFIIFLAMLVMAVSLPVGCGSKPARTTTMKVPVLESGPIGGELDGNVWTYLGIPYAAPPEGELRWKEPQPVAHWENVLPCDDYGPACPQPESRWGGQLEVGYTDEDCLYLNVWTPAKSPDEKLPVMVWIHGGAFTTGAGSLSVYDGHNLAGKSVIVVTINYRLGPLGFMAHPLLSKESPHGVSGNYGLEDQIAALEWVQENIDVFGGNPDMVTVFGESAGGMSICDLMVSPLAEGLFDRAIIESGPMLELGLPASKDNSLKQAEQKGSELAESLGCDEAGDVLACMRGKTPEELINAPKPASILPTTVIAQGPNVDGWVLPDSPVSLFAAGKQQRIPLITGVNADDGSIFAPDISPELYRTMLRYVYGDNANAVYALYPAETKDQVKPALSRLITEMGFAASAKFTATYMASVNSPAYLYRFNRLSKDPRAQSLGSFHGLDIVYVFGNFDMTQLAGSGPEDEALSQAMMNYWTGFAVTGDPNVQGVSPWPAYSVQTDQFQELATTVTTMSGYYPQPYDLVMKINGF